MLWNRHSYIIQADNVADSVVGVKAAGRVGNFMSFSCLHSSMFDLLFVLPIIVSTPRTLHTRVAKVAASIE